MCQCINVSDLARDDKVDLYFPSFRSVNKFNVNFLENKSYLTSLKYVRFRKLWQAKDLSFQNTQTGIE